MRNRITCLKDEHGKEYHNEAKMGKLAEKYFSVVYFASTTECDLSIWGPYQNRISESQNEDLTRLATTEEVKVIVFEMHPSKCSGLDSMMGYFFQHFWEDIGPAVCTMVNNFISQDILEKDITMTEIFLIPKTEDFRPITLCNTSYKVIPNCLKQTKIDHASTHFRKSSRF